jgi:hypothetical protein
MIRQRGAPEQARPHIAVAEALELVLPAQHGRKQRGVRDRGGIEGPRRPPVPIAHGPDEAIERLVGRRGIIDDGQRIEVPVIGRGRHGGVARQKRHALR